MRLAQTLAGFLALALTMALPIAARADDAADAVSVLTENCLLPLEAGTPLGEGLTRAAPDMEVKLLNGKQGKVYRATNPKVVVVAHDSGDTCEIMALGLMISSFDQALRGWLDAQDAYHIDREADMNDAANGGAYIVRAMEPGYVQAFIHTFPVEGFVGVTVSRVASSEHADEVLAPEPAIAQP